MDYFYEQFQCLQCSCYNTEIISGECWWNSDDSCQSLRAYVIALGWMPQDRKYSVQIRHQILGERSATSSSSGVREGKMAAVAMCVFEEPQSHTLHLRTLRQQLFGTRPSSITVNSRNPQRVLPLSSQTLFPICACLEGCHMPESCLPIWKCTRAFRLGKKFQGRSRRRCEWIKIYLCSYYMCELWLHLVLL